MKKLKIKKETMKIIRQGDVLLKEVRELPKNAKELTHKKEMTLALGEATGHHHTLYETTQGSSICEFLSDTGRFIKLDTEWLLRHQEHDKGIVPPGLYEIKIEREYDPFAKIMKKVVD